MTTVVSDDFNRADAANLGGNWTIGVGSNAQKVSGSKVTGDAVGTFSSETWTADSFGADQFSELELTSDAITTGQWVGVVVRAANRAGNHSGYLGICYHDGGGGGFFSVQLYKFESGTFTQFGSVNVNVGSSQPPAGTKLRLEVEGDKLRLYFAGDFLGEVTDTTYTSGGAPGMMFFGVPFGDNWSGGDYVPDFPSTPIIDDFNRAGGASAAGTTASDAVHVWSSGTINGDVDGGHIVSNAIQTVAGATDLYITDDFGPDVEAYMDLPDAPPSSEYAFLAARVQEEGSPNWDGYGVIWINGTGGQIRRYTNGSSTVLGATISILTIPDGGGLGLRIVGDELRLYAKGPGTTWILLATRIDSTYPDAGKIGYELSNGTLDNFGGGTIGGVVARPRFQAVVVV